MSSIVFRPNLTASLVKAKATTSTSRVSVVVKNTATSAGKKAAKSKSTEFCYGLPGNTAPMGDFDPFGFTKGKSEDVIRRYREAELTHGRVAMLASVGFVTAENFNPFFDGTIKGPAAFHFQQLPPTFWAFVLALIAVAEYLRLNKGWVDPGEKKYFTLKEDYDMGALGWDPLSLKSQDKAELDIMKTKELNHGRLAMFGILGEVAQELVSGKELFNLEDDGLLNDANCPAGVICDILEKSG
jgi:light-harvesting complex I chlorophyll a/b binding protein 1